MQVGFPKYVTDIIEADKLYHDLIIETDDVFVSNIIKMANHQMLMEVKKLDEEMDTDKDWLIQPLISNAFFDPSNSFISNQKS